MPVIPLDTPDDPALADFRATREGDLLRTRGVFICEGMLAASRLLAPDSRFSCGAMLADQRRLSEVLALLASTGKNASGGDGPPVYVLPPDGIERVIGFRFHHGVLATGLRGEEHRAASAIGSRLAPPPGSRDVALVLEDLRDHDNVGSCFRNAAAFGAAAVLLSPGCADPLYRKAIRTSMGHALRVPFGRFDEWPGGLSDLRDQAYRIVALTPGEGTAEIGAFAASLAPSEKIALLLGTEGAGLSKRALRAADDLVRIDMAPGADSINVAAAAAVALHRLSPM